MASVSRPYEIIVFGATGFTGKYTCEHIVTSLPTDLRWAVAGRSTTKLEALVKEIHAANPDRLEPAVETASLDDLSGLKDLVSKTKVLISVVGPYHIHGEAILAACAASGTHYVDVTGESPWVSDMIKRYDSLAKETGAIIIPQIGIESAPADILSWAMVTHARRTLDAGIKELIYSVYDMKAAPSGGTLNTLITIFEDYPLKEIVDTGKPWSLSPIAPSPSQLPAVPLSRKLLGVRQVRDLGTLTTSLQGGADATIVHRSWALYEQGKFYGPKFNFSPYVHVRNMFAGALVHIAIAIGLTALLLPPVRWLLKRLVTAPGSGPSKEETRHDHIEYRAMATIDDERADAADPQRINGRLEWQGSLYRLTGVFMAEAAMVLARGEEKTLAHTLGGGLLTPATLGAPFLERMQNVGMKVELKVMP